MNYSDLLTLSVTLINFNPLCHNYDFVQYVSEKGVALYKGIEFCPKFGDLSMGVALSRDAI